MFKFQDPQYLFLLAVIPVFLLIWIMMAYKRRKQMKKIGQLTLLAQLMPDVSEWRPRVKFLLFCSALTMLILMLARPQMGTKITKEKHSGIETIIAMDISNSMRATDVAPSRLDRSKMMIENMVDHFTDDKVGLLVFAGDAFVQLPITSDYVSAKMFLGSIDPSMISLQGTDIARAINMASSSFTQQEGVGRAIIVITDGEDHEGGAVEAAEEARKKGIRVIVLGVGSTSGAPIPIKEGSGEYMTDNTGEVVMSALNERMCKDIARAGGGSYIHVDNNSDAQRQLNNALEDLTHKEMETEIYSDYDEQFQAFGCLAIFFLIADALLLRRKNRFARRLQLFSGRRTGKTMLLLILLLTTLTVSAQESRRDIRQGNKAFHQQNYATAETAYRKALEKEPKNPQALYNLGNALMAQGKDSSAVREFEEAARQETVPLRRAMSYHNLGVLCQKKQLFAEAIEAYKNALRIDPTNDATRYNLALCKYQLKQQQQDNKNQQNQQKDGGKNKQQNKQDKQDKDDKQDKQDKQENDKQNQQPQPRQQDKQMSKENAEQLLNAAMQQEKDTQRKMKEAQKQPGKRQLDKNW